MAKPALDLTKLTPAEKLELIDELWTSITPEEFPLTAKQREELHRRLDLLDEDGPLGSILGECAAGDDAPAVNVILREEARSDVLQAFEGYEARREGLGVEYRNAVDATIARILRFPLAFEPGERGLRRALVSRFPHTLYFRVYPEAIVVAGVLHARCHAKGDQP